MGMRLYTVHLPGRAISRNMALDRAVFVREGFYVPAFLFGVFWCLWRGLWIPAVLVLAASGALYGLGHLFGLSTGWQLIAQLVLAVLIGLEASALRRFVLRLRGFGEAGSVSASDLTEAETLFFRREAEMTALAPLPVAAPRPGRDDEVVGLFPEPPAR